MMSQNLFLVSCFRWILRFSNVEIIRGFDLTFVALCCSTSYPFAFPYRIKPSPLDILKCIFTTLRNQDKKLVFIRVDKYEDQARSSEFMKTCYNMNIIVQNTGGDASSLNGKFKSSDKTLFNITRALLLNSSHKKELWCFVYQYEIWLSLQTDNRLHGDVTYLLWHVTIPSLKKI